MPDTPVYGFPYLALTDAPDIPAVTQGLAGAVESTLQAELPAAAKGLIKTLTTTSGDLSVGNTDTAEKLVDTINNVTVGPTGGANRAIRLMWNFMGTVGDAGQYNFRAKAYYKAATSFGTLSGATQFINGVMSWDWANFKDDLITIPFYTSLGSVTVYSFGLSIQRITAGTLSGGYTVRGSSNYPRRALLEDIGLGSAIA
jgi:hypothetical protein